MHVNHRHNHEKAKLQNDPTDQTVTHQMSASTDVVNAHYQMAIAAESAIDAN